MNYIPLELKQLPSHRGEVKAPLRYVQRRMLKPLLGNLCQIFLRHLFLFVDYCCSLFAHNHIPLPSIIALRFFFTSQRPPLYAPPTKNTTRPLTYSKFLNAGLEQCVRECIKNIHSSRELWLFKEKKNVAEDLDCECAFHTNIREKIDYVQEDAFPICNIYYYIKQQKNTVS